MSQVYDRRAIRRPQSVADIGRDHSALYHVFGVDVVKRGNLTLIEPEVVVYTVGNAVIFENIISKSRQYLRGAEDEGVGCVAVHPSKKLFAVGCSGFQPKVLIYSYPEMEIVKVLSGGAERGYSCMAFNSSGAKLATVATSPDYMLTLWDWEQERVGLHAKAFGQDVYSVRFSMDDELRLATCGTGHIRFWKMASTFTGLKLQGNIGKFGKVELSDVQAFVELPDGKIISGSESGALLLWEGNFIKCRFVLATGGLCHDGEVTAVEFDRKERCIITAGTDGYIRFWEFDAVDTAEVDSDISMDFQLMPLAEYHIGKGRGVKALVDSGSFDGRRIFVIQDTCGTISSVTFTLESNSLLEAVQNLSAAMLESKDVSTLIRKTTVTSGHSSGITGVDTSPIEHIAATCSNDGEVIVWDYLSRKQIGYKKFDVGCSVIRWLPLSLDGSGMSFAAGFKDGVVRVLTIVPRTNDKVNVILSMVSKPHNLPIVDISFSENGNFLASASVDGTVFIQNCKSNPEKWEPVGFVSIAKLSKSTAKGLVYCDRLSWAANGDSTFICNCSDGRAREVQVSDLTHPIESAEQMESFEYTVPVRDIQIKLVQVEGEGEAAKEVVLNLDTTSAVYLKNRKVNGIAAVSNFNNRSTLFEASTLDSEYSSSAEILFGLHSADGKEFFKPPTINCMKYSWSNRFLAVGSADGSICLKPAAHFETFMRFTSHNFYCGGVTAVASSFDDRFVLSSGKDGVLSVFRVAVDLVLSPATDALAKDIEAGVYANTKIKEVKPDFSEPSYLHMIVTANDFNEFSIEGFPADVNVISPPEDNGAGSHGKFNAVEISDLLPNAYSFEDDRHKSGEDSKKSSADILKDRIRAQIKAVRKEFLEICHANDNLPPSIRLSKDKLHVDGDFWDTLQEEYNACVDEIKKECEFEFEKSTVLRKNVSNFFTEGLLVEEITISGFEVAGSKEVVSVKSLRTRGLDPAIQAVLHSVRSLVKNEQLEEVQHRANEIAHQKAMAAIDDMKGRHMQKKEQAEAQAQSTESLDATKSMKGTSALARREARRIRLQALGQHEKEKPDDNEDDPRDISAIKTAEKTMGNYKMKSSDDYQISEEQRVNAQKKKQQMAMLEDTMASMRLQFNEKLLTLRDLKMKIIQNIQESNLRIKQIDKELSRSDRSRNLWQPVALSSEYPDDRDEVTEEELKTYQATREKKSWDKAEAPAHSTITGKKTVISKNTVSGSYKTEQKPPADESKFEVVLAKPNQQQHQVAPAKSGPVKAYFEVNDSVFKDWVSPATNAEEVARLVEIESCIPSLRAVRSIKETRLSISRPADFVQQICKVRQQELELERNMLVQKIEKSVKAFNDAVVELRVQRHALLADLKLAELRLLSLFREYNLLLTFEGRDLALQQKTQRCQNEKMEIIANIADNKAKLESKVEELKSWQDKMTALMAELGNVIPESNIFHEQLMKIFKKKIKRSRNRNGDEDEEEEDDDDDYGDEDDDEEEEVEDICPPGCEPILYEKVLDFREKRLDVEEASVDIQKSIEELKKALERSKQREKAIAKEGVQIDYEIQQFQLLKQNTLNQIDVLVPLRLSQVYCFEGNGVFTVPSDRPRPVDSPDNTELQEVASKLGSINSRNLATQIDMSNYVLFNKVALDSLDNRIHELHKECEEATVSFKELHDTRVQLKKQKQNLQKEIDALTKKCDDLQMLKFGRVLNLDELEAGADHSKEDEAELGVKEVEKSSRLAQNKLTIEINKLKEVLSEITVENTRLLNSVAELTEKKMHLNKDLDEDQPQVGQDAGAETVAERQERERITTYIKLQAREIEALRAEVAMLKRKDAPPIAIPSVPVPAGGMGESFLPPIIGNTNSNSMKLTHKSGRM